MLNLTQKNLGKKLKIVLKYLRVITMKIFYYRLIKIGTFRNMVCQDTKGGVKASYEC